MKKWIGLLFVSLLLGMSLLAPLGKTPQVSATSPSYTFYVRAFDILNNTTEQCWAYYGKYSIRFRGLLF